MKEDLIHIQPLQKRVKPCDPCCPTAVGGKDVGLGPILSPNQPLSEARAMMEMRKLKADKCSEVKLCLERVRNYGLMEFEA